MFNRLIALLLTALLTCLGIIIPVHAQVFTLPDLGNSTSWFPKISDDRPVSSCVYLDGNCVFKITSSLSDINQRVSIIERRLRQISEVYFRNPVNDLKIWQQMENGLPNIYISSGDQEVRLLTVTRLDSEDDGVDPQTKAYQMIDQLIHELETSKHQRTPTYLWHNAGISFGILIAIMILHYVISRRLKRLQKSKENLTKTPEREKPISSQLLGRQQWNIKEVQLRLFQLLQTGLWLAAILFILGRFPFTRSLQLSLIFLLRIPFRITLVTIAVYLLIRLSYALIAQLNRILMSNHLWELDTNPRLQLRAKTLTVVAKSIIILIWVSLGIIVALSLLGVNVMPIITGLGILGVGISLASQNLIRDAINGFFIIIEDQYAVGDVIEIGNYTGWVENMNLRITQLRDAEGKLVTIPNSEIKTVANLSNQWSRADVSIPVAYDADVDKALMLIKETADQMVQEIPWREMIIEEPQVLGIEHFDDRGLIIRVWIKTQPLKQWEVSREFRRRLKSIFEKANIPIPLPQHQLQITHYKTSRHKDK